MDPIAVHFHEIALKGKNRKVFEGQLRENLRAALADLGEADVRSVEGRIYVHIDADPDETIATLFKRAPLELIHPDATEEHRKRFLKPGIVNAAVEFDPETLALSGNSRVDDRAVTDFPDPLSPTSARVSPLRTSKLTPRTALVSAPS